MSEIGTCPLNTSPAESYYTSRYSGEQIDNLLTGLSFEIGGSYANLAAIQAAFPSGDTHAYQAADTKNIYVWNAKAKAWQSVGQLQGPIGPRGDTGAAAGFGVITATVDNNVGTPSASVTASGEDTSKNFHFAFKNLKGATGARGPTGAAAGFGAITATVDDDGGTPSVTVSSSGENASKNFNFAFKNIRGAQGPQGISGVAMAAQGFYAFNVNAAGHLILSYTGDTAPDFSIKADGHLYLRIV